MWERIFLFPCFESFFASICLNLAPVFMLDHFNNWAFALDDISKRDCVNWTALIVEALRCQCLWGLSELSRLSGSRGDVLGGREGSGGYAGWVVRKQATGTLSLSLSLCLNQLPAGDAPSCHPPAAHGPPYASLRKDIREWRVVPWPAIAAPSGADPPTCDLSLFGNCLPSSAVLFLH